MAVLNTTSPLVTPSAPMDWPLKTVPSARARMAGVNEGSNDTSALQLFSAYHVPSGKACASPLELFNLSILAENSLFRQIQGIRRVST
jgi:hypothetical protein